MIISTRTKLTIARTASRALNLARRAVGRGPVTTVVREGVSWELDLREGIDLALYLGVYERATMKTLRRLAKPGTTALDIGANIGAHTLPLAKNVGDEGRVHAFEPTAFAHGKLRANLALNPSIARRVVLEQLLLTDDPASFKADAIYSSWPLETRKDLHEKHQGALKSTEGARAIRLDDYLEQAKVAKVDLVKMDVDGHECSVLRGAPRLLASRPVIVMELAPYVLAERGHSLKELLSLLSAVGYRLEHETSGAPLPEDAATIEAMIGDGRCMNVIAR
jgi:FkbM family methyltransferase